MDVDFVDKLVEVVLMASAKVNEGLNRHIWVSRHVLSLRFIYDGYGVVRKVGKVCNRVVNIGRFVDSDEGFVEDGEKIAEELQRNGLRISVARTERAKGKYRLTSSMTDSIIVLSRCLVQSRRNCLSDENSWAPCFISSSTCTRKSCYLSCRGLLTFSTALFQATYALKTFPMF